MNAIELVPRTPKRKEMQADPFDYEERPEKILDINKRSKQI
jgi:hypothetical protein